jgi:hypothetical protein
MRALTGVLLASALLLGGCGAADSTFPAEVECAQPAPLPTARGGAGQVFAQAYINSMRTAADSLTSLRSELRATYPEDTFYRKDDFRPDFAAYADQTICTAQAMLSIAPPDARFAAFRERLDTALNALIEHTRAGRDAVRARNVSAYRDWYSGADARISEVREAAYAQR